MYDTDRFLSWSGVSWQVEARGARSSPRIASSGPAIRAGSRCNVYSYPAGKYLYSINKALDPQVIGMAQIPCKASLIERSSRTQPPSSRGDHTWCMKLLQSCATVLAAALSIAGTAMPARAITNTGNSAATPYVAAFAPLFGTSGVPHSGTMRLVVHDGTIIGTYSGTSVGPDYLDNRIVPVTGSVSDADGYVALSIGGALSLHGSMAGDGTITGTATYNGRLYEFMARPGSPGSGV